VDFEGIGACHCYRAEECPPGSGGAILFGDLDDPESAIFKLLKSGKAKPLLLGNTKDTRVYFVPSKSEPSWGDLPTDQGFLQALGKRKGDLPPIKGVL